MSSEAEMARSLDQLKEEIGRLSHTVQNVRYEDFKKVVLTQVQYVMTEHYRGYLEANMERIDCLSSCPLRNECRKQLDSIFQGISSCFMRDDFPSAMEELDRAESLIGGLHSPCQSRECHDLQLGMVRDVRSLVSFMQRISERIGGPLPLGSAPVPEGSMDLGGISRMMAPLAHPARLQVLCALGAQDRTFTDLSRELDMRTGHLQFHLRPLLDEGYVSKQRNRGDYSITPRGRAALDLLSMFSQRLTL
jgi:DNA-binding transcriptional ArsR family regulator